MQPIHCASASDPQVLRTYALAVYGTEPFKSSDYYSKIHPPCQGCIYI